jgi:hypothetical protein
MSTSWLQRLSVVAACASFAMMGSCGESLPQQAPWQAGGASGAAVGGSAGLNPSGSGGIAGDANVGGAGGTGGHSASGGEGAGGSGVGGKGGTGGSGATGGKGGNGGGAAGTIGETFGAVDGNNTGYSIGASAVQGEGVEYPVYTTGDYTATTAAELAAALANATSGQVVFVPGTAHINLDGMHVSIPAGVTLASDRGHSGSAGGRVYWTAHTGPSSNNYMIVANGNQVRVTGLRLEGDYGGTSRLSDIGYQEHSGMDGSIYSIEVDNCEIFNWPVYGVVSRWEESYGTPLTTNSTVTNAYVHHNYIHDIQSDGYGYGVGVRGGHVTVEANIFDWNRHCIAAAGYPDESYEVRYNIHFGHSSYWNVGVYYHLVDVHAYPHHPGDSYQSADQRIGDYYYIHHNTFQNLPQYAVGIRAVPTGRGVFIDHNIFAEISGVDKPPVWQRTVGAYGGMFMSNNLIGKNGATPIRVVGEDILYYQGHTR